MVIIGVRKGFSVSGANRTVFAGGSLKPELVDLVAGDRNVFLLVRMPPADNGGGWMRVVVYEIVGEKIAGARVFEDDPTAAAAYFERGNLSSQYTEAKVRDAGFSFENPDPL